MKIEADLSAEQVLAKIQEVAAADGSDADGTLVLDLGHKYSKKDMMLDDPRVFQALVDMIVATFHQKKWKEIRLEFATPGFIPQFGKKEEKWCKLEQKAQQQTSDLARKLQRKLELDETEIHVDGDVHEHVEATSEVKYEGVGIISFPKHA